MEENHTILVEYVGARAIERIFAALEEGRSF